MGRQWRNLKEWKWFGFGQKQGNPGPAELALFCPACPQPGINLPESWEDDPTDWYYWRSFVADGNFVAVHQLQPRSVDDVWIKNGEGFMTERTRYQEHLDCTTEQREVSSFYSAEGFFLTGSQPTTCHEHRAVLDKSKCHKGCDVSGIGALACLRHGCYAPGSVVDFQKGERQMNMDYSLCEAIKYSNVDQVPGVILAYDIACQYSVNLRKRIMEGPFLDLSVDLPILPAIGLFHVHGHQEKCYARYAPTFVRGIGKGDGEILETNWGVLNGISPMARTMTLAHRTEVMDAHFADNNWKKMVNMGQSLTENNSAGWLFTCLHLEATLCNKWKDMCKRKLEHVEDFDIMTETASAGQIETWTQLAETADERRLFDVTAMDIYNISLPKDKLCLSIKSLESVR